MTQVVGERQQTHFEQAAAVKTGARLITPRAILLSVLLIIANDFWLVKLEVVRYSFGTYAAPFWTVIFTLFFLTLANMQIARRLPRAAFSRQELMTIYVMVSISSAVCSHNMMQILMSFMGYATRYATPENNWHNLFEKDLPTWLVVKDPVSLANLYQGGTSMYRPENLRPWIVPVICWSGFCFVLLSTMLFINCILRKHWTESERLSFPVIHLPFEMVSGSSTFWRNRLLWAGFAVAGGITLLNGLNYLWPSIPGIPIKRYDLSPNFRNHPWNAIGGLNRAFYFWAIGISFLMPLDLSFSCSFFYVLHKLELVLTAARGWNDNPIVGGGFDSRYPCLNSQAFGAYTAVFATTLWSARKYLLKVLRTAFTRRRELDESGEPISYRTAVLGTIIGFILLSLFALRIGMSLWVVVIFFLAYFMLAVVVTRIRAELGFPIHDMHVMSPPNLLTTIVPTETLGTKNLIGFSLFHWFNRTYASHPMPHQLEGYKFAERTRTPARQMMVAILIAAALAMPVGFWALLYNYFHYGAGTAKMEQWALGFGRETWNRLDGWLKRPLPTNWTSIGFVCVGFTFASWLSWMRLRFLWFPFHPMAYAVANSWGMAQIWMPLILGSLAKYLVLRYAGLGGYKKYLPFFLGLMLGEIVIGGCWTLYGIIGGFRTYDFWP